MFKLGQASLGAAYDLYRKHGAFFPLIGAVLLGQQAGVVFVDRPHQPRRVYVEHAFGFAQLFGVPEENFDEALRHYLTIEKSFSPAKVRLYTPCEPEFLQTSDFDALRSQRQRFVLDTDSAEFTAGRAALQSATVEVKALDQFHLEVIESRFQVTSRFWRTGQDFVEAARAVVAWMDGQPAAICYAAAVADSRAEIDVLTAPEHRQAGLGRLVVQAFKHRCLQEMLHPVWDCFTNNTGSMSLCRATGFKPASAPYPFYTFSR